MTLEVDVEKTLGNFGLSASFTSTGKVTALFGRSGAGKSTLLNMIAGLVEPDRGAIRLDEEVFFDSRRRIDRSLRRRRIGYVFQEGRLFPHYSVRGNLMYGRKRARRKYRWGSFDQIVGLLGIGDLLDRRPASLSGGEKQRVAIGRALLASPRLLLMDEPLASLDAARKEEILPYIERLRDEMKLPMVYVSHSVDEVTRLADDLVLLSEGKVVASGTVNEVFGRSDLRRYTGRFEASVTLFARVVAHDPPSGTTILDHPAGRMWISMVGKPVGEEVRLRVRARDVALAVGEPGLLSIRNRLEATVTEIAAGEGAAVEVQLDAAGQPLISRISRDAARALDLAVGQPVVALIKSAAFDRLDDLA
jgi:molybdate transport system ATP-binding protein